MAAPRDRLGRPTQFHGVPLEERAIDANGNRLPWAYDYPDDHPQARFQKRPLEEKGAFGKTGRRTGSARVTRTQTPAKKENPTIDGFAAALKYDQQSREAEGRTAAAQNPLSTDATSQPLSSSTKEPRQILIYGFASEFQWSAISFYERVSGGMICEDYPRDPPPEKRRYSSGIANTGAPSIRRTLTQAERVMASQYHGGECWIVVTLDSPEAADRVVAASPHAINGYWVFAEPWRGLGPIKDKPILGTEDAESAKSATMGAGGALKRQDSRQIPLTFPRQTRPSVWEASDPAAAAADDITDSSTVTSATATATAVEESENHLRSRVAHDSESVEGGQANALTPMPSKTHFTHFPNTPRTMIKPVSEALLPQPSWWEGVLRSLATSGWIPGDMIGSSVPRKEDGTFDLDAASIYWRFWHWIDSIMGTDLCGLKDDS